MKRVALNLGLFCILGYSGSIFAFELLTIDEICASREASSLQEASTSPVDPMAPQITIVDPDSIDKAIKNPFTMEVLFKSHDGSPVDFKTFQALYGSLKLDITSRLMKEAIKTSSGIKLTNVNVPSGTHRIVLRIKDSQNRLAEKELFFKVE
jgi:hypothetical protein